MNLKERFEGFLEGHSLTQATVARSLGVSKTALSQTLNGKYSGDVQAILEKIEAYMENFSENRFVNQHSKTIHVKSYLNGIGFLSVSASRSGMYLLIGGSGTGKTTVLKAFKRRTPNAILIEVWAGMTKNRLLRELAEKLNIELYKKESGDVFKRICDALQKRDAVILIDECEYLSHQALETLRRIYDFAERGVIVLAGTDRLLGNLKGTNSDHRQLYRRIKRKWSIGTLDAADTMSYFESFGITLSKDEAATIVELTDGNFGLISNLAEASADLIEIEGGYGMSNQELINVALQAVII